MTAKQPKPKPMRRFIEHEAGWTILDSMNQLFREWFSSESWDGWRTVLKAAYALPMTEDEVSFFKSIAGDRDPPERRVKELWCVCGRRSGKSAIISLIAAHAGIFFKAGVDRLRPGEKALVQTVAVDRAQAKVVHGFVESYFDFLSPLRSMVVRRRSDELSLCNDVTIATSSNSFRSVRGRTVLVSVFDEVAYWKSEDSATPDVEVYNAVVPSMASLPEQSMLCAISSPYRKGGLLWNKYRKHFGVDDDDILIVQAGSRVLNPTLDEKIIAKALEEDPQAARAEWLGLFRDDITNFVDADVIDACVMRGVRELPPMNGYRYAAFCDPSGGSSDSMTLAIVHREGDKAVVDAIRERRPPFSPDDCVIEFAATLKAYGIGTVRGDRYGGMWPAERFAAHGVRYEPCEQPKSDLYQALLPVLNAKRVELLDHPRLINQLIGLERRTTRAGKDSIDHAVGSHDDIANAVAGAVSIALGHQGVVVTSELLQRVAAMPARRKHTAWGFHRRAALASFLIPREQQCYPRSALPASKFEQGGESR